MWFYLLQHNDIEPHKTYPCASLGPLLLPVEGVRSGRRLHLRVGIGPSISTAGNGGLDTEIKGFLSRSDEAING
jgi:hypothetical protein